MEEEPFDNMNEIVPNLWLGNLLGALDAKTLREKNIRSVVTAMRGKLAIDETFVNHRVEIDDSPDEDVLSHLVPAITFIEKELDRNRGVLVHCLAGVSRSSTIVAAYLMYAQGLDVQSALQFIRLSRPIADPNEGFVSQLEIFRKAHHTVSSQDRATRMFYLERIVKDVLNAKGDESLMREVFTKFPASELNPDPTQNPRQRRIRCKMCRQELATRAHIMDHGQVPAASTSRTPPVTEHLQPPLSVEDAARLGEQLSESLWLEETRKPNPSDTETPSAESSNIRVGSAQSSSSSAKSTDQQLPRSIPLPANYAGRARPAQPRPPVSPPILANPKCSGYFVEPLKWMEPFLSKGEHAGKIVCPNKKCNAKLGNYDWAGVCCSCKEWVVPGFCIHRSKVDEVM